MAADAAGIPEAAKRLIGSYMIRAAQVEKHALTAGEPMEERIAYYCRYYSMLKLVRTPGAMSDAEVQGFCTSLMGKLEADKGRLGISKASEAEDRTLVLNFALRLFAKAQKDDQEERADEGTAKAFKNAGELFEVLTVFGDVTERETQMRLYSKAKALDIVAAIKEGRTPMPGPPRAEARELVTEQDEPAAPLVSAAHTSLSGHGGHAPAPSPPPELPSLPDFPGVPDGTPKLPPAPSSAGTTPRFTPSSGPHAAGGGGGGGGGGGHASHFPSPPTSVVPPSSSYAVVAPPSPSSPFVDSGPIPVPHRRITGKWPREMVTATRHATATIGFLRAGDVDSAISNLQEALATLERYKRSTPAAP